MTYRGPRNVWILLIPVTIAALHAAASGALFDLRAQSPLKVIADLSDSGPAVPVDFTGLSYEMKDLLPTSDGKYLFSPQNKVLADAFRTMGIKSLRIGGNTADRPSVRLPSCSDIDNLFAFARVAGVRVIYTLRMREGKPAEAAETVQHILQHHGEILECFAIGNEPNVFVPDYEMYRKEWKRYAALIGSVECASGARFCGPGSTPGRVSWSRDFAADFAGTGRIRFVTQHAYPGGNSMKVSTPEAGRADMLSPRWLKSYEEFYDAFAPAVAAAGLPYRLEETNSYYNAGADGVSNSFAAALWGLDYLHWWASHGAAGINFHTGDSVAAGEATMPCRYAVLTTSSSGYTVHPLGYALKAFDLASHGGIVPVRMAYSGDSMNVTAYAHHSSDRLLLVTVINKEHGPGRYPTDVIVSCNRRVRRGDAMFLTTPDGDIAATTGTRLGGAEIGSDGTWEGEWTQLALPPARDHCSVRVPAAAAAVIRLTVE